MDAEIRKLAYTPRSTGPKAGSNLPGGISRCVGELPPFLRKVEAAKQPVAFSDVQLQARVIELEREREQDAHRHGEALAATREKASHEIVAALQEQKESLMREYASSVQTAIAAFQQEQDRYFGEAETAVVRLALSIAARILHREAQLDPVMLRGPVRVALEDVRQSAVCVLEVSARETEMWQTWLAEAGMPSLVQVRGREDAPAGHCTVEIGGSSADLSVDAQLKEIEHGFFDLLKNRPSAMNGERRLER